jgi:hypothetical protein
MVPLSSARQIMLSAAAICSSSISITGRAWLQAGVALLGQLEVGQRLARVVRLVARRQARVEVHARASADRLQIAGGASCGGWARTGVG